MNHNTSHDHPASIGLSPAARERKSAMFAELRRELRARRTRRSFARGGSAVALMLATATVVWFVQRPLPEAGRRGGVSALKPLPQGEIGVGSMASTPTADGQSPMTPPARLETPKISIAYVQTDPTILDRLATKAAPTRIEQITDDELLHAMQDAGRPAGLIRANGKLTIVEQRDANATVGG